MLRQLVRLALPPILTSAFTLVMMLVLAASTGRTAQAGPRPEPPERESKDEGSPLREPIVSGVSASTSLSFTITLSEVASGVAQPVYLTHAGDGSGRLFVVEQVGRIKVITNGVVLAPPYLDISSIVESGSAEQGLLSVAFDRDFETNGTFYVNYTAKAGNGDTVVARYVAANPSSNVANPIAVTHLITIDQPQANHNGGQLQFGPNDNYLYIGMGDGGGSNDQGSGHAPEGNGQSPGTLLGKMLRIDVRGVPTYTIPPSNPFTQTAGYLPEIWALGLRNPWRFSFDRATGDLYIGDVGQNCY
ncbi:MAG: PQQ-dependent sugar dehydrogenase, partial [Anaerolineae bacterium]